MKVILASPLPFKNPWMHPCEKFQRKPQLTNYLTKDHAQGFGLKCEMVGQVRHVWSA